MADDVKVGGNSRASKSREVRIMIGSDEVVEGSFESPNQVISRVRTRNHLDVSEVFWKAYDMLSREHQEVGLRLGDIQVDIALAV